MSKMPYQDCLEPAASTRLVVGDIGRDEALRLSQVISLKRIADTLERAFPEGGGSLATIIWNNK